MKFKLLAASTLLSLGFTVQSQANTPPEKISATTISTYAKTRYPIVFSHGMTGFIRIGTDTLGVDYWYQILPDLARNGGNIWATRVSPFHSSEERGEQLLRQVEDVIALTGSNKVNLVGHSHGGPTIRYVAGVKPEYVASMTSIGAPHKGSPVSDFILKLRDIAPFLETPVTTVVNLYSKAVVWAQGLDPHLFPHDSLAGANSLSLPGSALFNQKYPIGIPTSSCGEGKFYDSGIYNYSFAGIGTVTNILDPDSALKATSLLIDNGKNNDGLVGRCSAKFGKTVRDDYNWNHLDEVNQVLGLKALLAPDPVSVYRQHANRLKLQGL